MWKKYFLAVLFYLLPLIFHGQFQVIYKPFIFSQLAVIFISLTMLVAIASMPLTVRLFYIWCIVTTFTSRTPQFSAIALMVVTIIIALYGMIIGMRPEDIRFSFKFISIGACVQVFWLFTQSVNRDFVMNLPRDVNLMFGTMGNKNLLGALFLMAIVPMYFYKRWFIILPIMGILYSKASASIFALGGGVLFYLLFINFRKSKNYNLIRYDLKWWHVRYCRGKPALGWRYNFSQRFMKFVIIAGLVGGLMGAWQYVDNPFTGLKYGRWPVWKKIMTLMFPARDEIEVLIKEGKEKGLKSFDTKIKEANEYLEETKAKKTGWFYTKSRNKKEVNEATEKVTKLKEDRATIAKIEVPEEKKKGKIWDIRFIENIRNPWLGYGLGTFKFEFPKRLTGEEAGGVTTFKGKVVLDSEGKTIPIAWRRAHNTYLQTGREQGLIGMFFLILIPGMLFAYFLRIKKTEKSVVWMSAVVMICMNAVGNFPDRNFTLMYYMLFILAVYKKEVIDVEKLRTDCVSRFVARDYAVFCKKYADYGKEIGRCFRVEGSFRLNAGDSFRLHRL